VTDRVIKLIRRACAPAIWSKGVSLARAGAVTLESRDDDEIVLRVASPESKVAPTVVIYPGEEPGDEEWDCDCRLKMRPCPHIAAAAIALDHSTSQSTPKEDGGAGEDIGKQGPPTGPASRTTATEAPPLLRNADEAGGRILYDLKTVQGGVRLQRSISQPGGGKQPLTKSVAGLLANPATARTIAADTHDVRADQLLQSRAGGILPSDKLRALLAVLAEARTVSVDGQPVSVSPDVVKPQAFIEDEGDNVVVVIRPDDSITRVIAGGVALCGDKLALLGETDMTGLWLQSLPSRQVFTPSQRGELKTRILPDLKARMVVRVRSSRLPETVRDLPPRIQLQVERAGDDLSVLPLLVYGTPICARIDDGRLVHLDGPVPVRDERAEQILRHRLRTELNLLPGRRCVYSGADVATMAERLQQFRGDIAGGAARFVQQRSRLVPHVDIQAKEDGNGLPQAVFALTFSVEDENGNKLPNQIIDGQTVVDAWQQGLGLVPLGDGGFAPLPADWLARFGERIADLLAARDAAGKLATHALPEAATLCVDLEQPAPPALSNLASMAERFSEIAEAPLPKDLNAELRPYQRAGVNWLSFLRRARMGALLADDMGLGKTLQTLAALSGRCLVVCPTSVMGNWRDEAAKFRPGLSVNIFHGSNRSLNNADITITSYALVRNDRETLGAIDWDCVVLDEAQAIKNPKSQTAQAAYALSASFRVALSGTPVENRLDELWSVMNFCNRGLLGGRGDFDVRYARPIAAGDNSALSKLRQRTKPFVLRRLKTEVAPELPPRLESTLHVALEAEERSIYDAVAAAARKEVAGILAKGGSVMAALEQLLRLRQAACHPALVPGQTANTSSKVARLVEVLGNAVADGHKALVFSQWTTLLDLIEPHLQTADIDFARLDGTTANRDAVVKRFQDSKGPPVMLMSLKAGGTGLNLVAADHVFICDPWWNPAAEAQAADRAHRIGQDKPVIIYRMVSDDTVEERIVALQDKKRALAQAAVGEGGAAAGLTRDDLLSLLA